MREQCRWVVEKHGDFQLIYYGEHVGADPNKRAAYEGAVYFNDCVEFCARWDQTSFDPDYKNLPLSFFAPMVREVFARTPYDEAVINAPPMPLVDKAVGAERLTRAKK